MHDDHCNNNSKNFRWAKFQDFILGKHKNRYIAEHKKANVFVYEKSGDGKRKRLTYDSQVNRAATNAGHTLAEVETEDPCRLSGVCKRRKGRVDGEWLPDTTMIESDSGTSQPLQERHGDKEGNSTIVISEAILGEMLGTTTPLEDAARVFGRKEFLISE
ncbi:hypothetical protein RRG08_033576 [Elysia crispata]|uniref:Uncharacterized protein n=1 Tax=Elysia crispata TaxID=231223 RepID=A0AAE1CJI8_9GAST|nr:hypothetical protein RRG08_033576 [Elysia crispata]